MLDKETTDLMDLRMKEPPPPYLQTVESAHPWFSFSNLKCLFHPFTPLPKLPKVPKLLKITIDPPTTIPSPPPQPQNHRHSQERRNMDPCLSGSVPIREICGSTLKNRGRRPQIRQRSQIRGYLDPRLSGSVPIREICGLNLKNQRKKTTDDTETTDKRPFESSSFWIGAHP